MNTSPTPFPRKDHLQSNPQSQPLPWQERMYELIFYNGLLSTRIAVLAALRREGLTDQAIDLFMKTAEVGPST